MTRAERNLAKTLTRGAHKQQAAKESDPKGKQWWRIEVDGAGKVVSCEPVELKESDQALIFYVEAKNRAQAGRRHGTRTARSSSAGGASSCARRANARGAHAKMTV